MPFLANILITAATIIVTTLGVINFAPMKWLGFGETKFGTTLTSLTSTDKLSDFPTTYNANLTALNNGKVEVSTTTMTLITSLPNLATIGTITTGIWNATAIPVNKGGTGTTSPSIYMVMLGNGASGLTMASTTGTSGQVLTSNGASLYPSWQSSTVNENDSFNFTGTTFRVKNFHASSTAANPMYLNGIDYAMPVAEGATSTVLTTNGSGSLIWDYSDWTQLGETILTGTNSTTSVSGLPARKDLMVDISIPSEASAQKAGLEFNSTATGYGYTTNQEGTFARDSTRMMFFVVNGTTSPQFYKVFINNESGRGKLVTWSGTILTNGANAPYAIYGSGVWNNTAQVTTVSLGAEEGANVYPIGTRVTVYGKRN